jgi:hypothetical protein
MLNKIPSSAHNAPKFGIPIETGLTASTSIFVKNMTAHAIRIHNSENKKYKADASKSFLNALSRMLLDISVKKK